jgi:hypothetical protein
VIDKNGDYFALKQVPKKNFKEREWEALEKLKG